MNSSQRGFNLIEFYSFLLLKCKKKGIVVVEVIAENESITVAAVDVIVVRIVVIDLIVVIAPHIVAHHLDIDAAHHVTVVHHVIAADQLVLIIADQIAVMNVNRNAVLIHHVELNKIPTMIISNAKQYPVVVLIRTNNFQQLGKHG